jgi:hypothetical protein
MATKQAARPAPGKNVARSGKGGAMVDSEMLKMMGADAGKGVSTASEDNIVPLLYLLQKGSPQLDRADKVKYIKGAKDGDIWVRGTTTVIDGEEEGIEVVPCHFSKCWIQWKPNRGGFVGRHLTRPAEAVLKEEETDGGGTRNVWRMKNGDAVVETREYVVIITSLPKPLTLVIPMSSTNHTPAREWMGLINNCLIPGSDKTAPIYGYKYRMRSVPKKNDQGSWYMWSITHAGEEDGAAVPLMVDDIELYKAAKKINADFTSGALRPDAPEEDGHKGDNGDDDM